MTLAHAGRHRTQPSRWPAGFSTSASCSPRCSQPFSRDEASSPVRTLRAIPAALVKGFSEWQTLLVLLGLTLFCAPIAVVPDLGTLFGFYGHAPLAEGQPLVSFALLLRVSQAYPTG